MIKALVFHFKSALKNLIRHITGTILSVSGVTVILTLIGFFIILSTNLDKVVTGITQNIRIQASIDSTVKNEEIKKIQKEIESITNVSKVEYKTKHDELEVFIKNSVNGEESFAQYRGDANPLRDTFYVELKAQTTLLNNHQSEKQTIQKVRDEISKIKGIVEVQYGGSVVEKMIIFLSNIKVIGYIITGVLGILSIVLIQNTIKTGIHNRQNEISIMRSVGASNWFIKIPFMFEGIMLGFLGSLLPAFIIIFGYPPLYHLVASLKIVQFIHPYPFVYQVSGMIALVGVVMGLLGAFLSTNKYLRFKR